MDWIIISEDNTLYNMWSVIHIVACLTSSYFYAYMAAFEDPAPGTMLFNLNWGYEIIFWISLGLSFLVDFKPEGSAITVRDLK